MAGNFKDCFVCLESGTIECVAQCENALCVDCLDSVLENALSEQELPTCSCNSVFDHSHLAKFSPSLMEQCIDAYVTKLVSPMQSVHAAEVALVDNLKTKWLAEKPPAIATMARVFFKNSLDNLCKLNAASITLNNSTECAVEHCTGMIMMDMPCTICNARLCKKCTMPYTDLTHVCDTNTLLSVKALQMCVACPWCKRKVEKIDGCNNMTCPYCKKNFEYVYGKPSVDGTDVSKRIELVEKMPSIEHMLSDKALKDQIRCVEALMRSGPTFIERDASVQEARTFAIKYFVHKCIHLEYDNLKKALTDSGALQGSLLDKFELRTVTLVSFANSVV